MKLVKRAKSSVLCVSRRRTPDTNMVATMLTSWIRRPRVGTSVNKVSRRAVTSGQAAREPNDPTFAMAVRYLLEALSELRPGNTVEVRVPPLGAVQCVPGPTHTRGTPPNTVEMNPDTWFALATGSLSWSKALAEAKKLLGV